MARGYPGAFGRRVNAWYVWIPLCVLFIAPFLPWRRRRLPGGGRERRAWSLLHLDLLALLGFSISLALFNHAKIGLSTPAIYPFMLYLLVRMLLLGFGRGRPRRPLRLFVPVSWLAIGVIFLVGFRVGLNVINSNVIDVGYAGVIGADKLLHGQPLYGNWPKDNAQRRHLRPGQLLRLRAVPDDLRLERNLGRPPRGPRGRDRVRPAHAARSVSCWAAGSAGRRWASCSPTRGPRIRSRCGRSARTATTALVALLLVLALLVITSAPARGVVGALAGLTKFAPFALAPLLLRGIEPPPPRRADRARTWSRSR